MAVRDFEFGTVQQWWDGNWDVGKGIADMLADRLLADGSVRLLERRRLQDVTSEQDLARSDRIDSGTVTNGSSGTLLRAQYLVVGSVTRFGAESKDFGTGGLGGGWLGGIIGAIGMKKTYANVAITCRIVDAAKESLTPRHHPKTS